MDMLDALENDLAFEADLYLVEDSKYGEIVNGSWVGLVGELESGKADMVRELKWLTTHYRSWLVGWLSLRF